MSDKRKIQFDGASQPLPGWENYGPEVNCTHSLPRDKFPDNSADFIFAEMLLQKLQPKEAWLFLEDCLRLLKPGGILRVVIPDFAKIWRDMDDNYRHEKQKMLGTQTDREHMQSIVFGHGQHSVWTAPMLEATMEAVGFVRVFGLPMHFSNHDELRDLEQSWQIGGKDYASVESGCVEGMKP